MSDQPERDTSFTEGQLSSQVERACSSLISRAHSGGVDSGETSLAGPRATGLRAAPSVQSLLQEPTLEP